MEIAEQAFWKVVTEVDQCIGSMGMVNKIENYSLFACCIYYNHLGQHGAERLPNLSFLEPHYPLARRLTVYMDAAYAQAKNLDDEAIAYYKLIAEKTRLDTEEEIRAIAKAVGQWRFSASRRSHRQTPQSGYSQFHTGMEIDTVSRVLSAPRSGWTKDFLRKLLVASPPALNGNQARTHKMIIEMTPEEELQGITLEDLESLYLEGLSSRMIPALHYVLQEFTPTGGQSVGEFKVEVDFNEVIRFLEWNPESAAQRETYRNELWTMARFLQRAEIHGERFVKGESRPETKIAAPLWTIVEEIRPDASEAPAPPEKVIVKVNARIARLLTDKQFAQYLDDQNVIAKIPHGNKARGAWAKSMGYSLLNAWRRNPKLSITDGLTLSREEVLMRYPPHLSLPLNILVNGGVKTLKSARQFSPLRRPCSRSLRLR